MPDPKPTPSFPLLLQRFFVEHLGSQRAVSPRTIAAYRDTFRLLLSFAEAKIGKAPTRLALADFDAQLILSFLDHLEKVRSNGARSRNARLAALRSFLKYAAHHDLTALPAIEQALAIPMKRFERPVLGFLSRDEMQAILDAIKRVGARRLVIDSLVGFEMALAPSFRTDFRESLYRMIFALTAIGITILSTLEMPETFTELLFSSYSISFLTDDIIRMRYVEIDGQLSQIMMVVKMRRGTHSRDIRQYEITTDGIVIGKRFRNYVDLITGIPQPLSVLRAEETLLNRKV